MSKNNAAALAPRNSESMVAKLAAVIPTCNEALKSATGGAHGAEMDLSIRNEGTLGESSGRVIGWNGSSFVLPLPVSIPTRYEAADAKARKGQGGAFGRHTVTENAVADFTFTAEMCAYLNANGYTLADLQAEVGKDGGSEIVSRFIEAFYSEAFDASVVKDDKGNAVQVDGKDGKRTATAVKVRHGRGSGKLTDKHGKAIKGIRRLIDASDSPGMMAGIMFSVVGWSDSLKCHARLVSVTAPAAALDYCARDGAEAATVAAVLQVLRDTTVDAHGARTVAKPKPVGTETVTLGATVSVKADGNKTKAAEWAAFNKAFKKADDKAKAKALAAMLQAGTEALK